MEMNQTLNSEQLKNSVFKAKFCIYVAITFIICHSFKAVGVQGFYGLYAVETLNRHHLEKVPQWVESIGFYH